MYRLPQQDECQDHSHFILTESIVLSCFILRLFGALRKRQVVALHLGRLPEGRIPWAPPAMKPYRQLSPAACCSPLMSLERPVGSTVT